MSLAPVGRADEADVVVYGGTSAGIVAAVQAKRMGQSVVLVCPDKHLGGLSSGGLGFTDIGDKSVIGGLAREFYHRIWRHYQEPDAWRWQPREQFGNRGQGAAAIDRDKRTMWVFEPHVAEQVFEEMIAEHETYQKGLMYFLAHDRRVPADVRERMSQWGLAKDEFVDNGNWPHQLYIREARRMIGRYVMTEHDCLCRRPTPEPVGMGSYTMDSHNVQRYVTEQGLVQNEGDVGVSPPRPYAVAYGALVPKRAECTNLVVPVCVSSSHISYGSIRMEPVFMILGQSAATAASLAIDGVVPVQDVDYAQLRTRLVEDGQILEKE